MVKNILLLMVMSFCSEAQSQTDNVQDPLTWWNQLPYSAWQDQPTVIRQLAIWSSNEAHIKHWDKTMQDFSSLGFLQYVPHDVVKFIQILNPQKNLSKLSQNLLFDPSILQLVLLDRGSIITVLGNTNRSLKKIASWPVTNQDIRSSVSFLNWLSKNLGYDAVVLDARGGMILAGLLKNTNELGQGLLVKQSSKRWIIKESSTSGEALLQMLKVSGSLAVFEVLLAEGETLSVEKGSKILLGQNASWMRLLHPEPATLPPKPLPQSPGPATLQVPSEAPVSHIKQP